MPRYRYVALDDGGGEIKGDIESISETAARDALLQRNLDVRQVRKAPRKLSEIEITAKRVTPIEIMHFSRQLGAFVRAGIPITDGLDVIAEGVENRRWREILLHMRETIAQGVQFSDALAEHEDIWPPYYIGIVRSAELTGRLDVALDQLSSYMDRDLETRTRIKSALLYPLIVLLLAVGVIAILTVYVLPKFADFFDGLGADLPLTTRTLVGIADFSANFWWVYVAAVVLLGVAAVWLTRTESGRRVRDQMLLRIPLVRDIVVYAVVERLSRILGAMSQAGVPLPDAMSAAIRGANNTVFEDGLVHAQERMMEGEGLAEPVAATGLFPRAAIQMMRVGEDTGTLDQQLENAAQYYSRELDYRLKRLTTLFEPIVIVVMGVIVGFVAIALVQAMYGIYHSPELQDFISQ